MRFDAPPISIHRISRLHRWVLLWLTWLVRFLEGAARFAPISKQVEAIAHRWLDTIERGVINLVMAKAIYFHSRRNVAPPPFHREFATPRKRRGLRRALIGSRLRRALKRRDLGQRIAALTQNIDDLVALWLNSRPHALTRRRAIRARREDAARCVMLHALLVAFAADTS